MAETSRSNKSTGRSGVTLVAAFSCCSDDPKNSDGGYITGLAVHLPTQHLLAVDNDAGVVKVFTQAGVFLYSFGKGLLVEPWDVFITSSGKIAISDPGAGDIKVFSNSGKYLLKSERGFHLHEPYGIDYHPWTKETVIADKQISCVYIHGPGGTVKDIITKHGGEQQQHMIKCPHYTCFDPAGNIYITDKEDNSLHAFDPELQFLFTYGHSGKADEQLHKPSGVVVDRYGNVMLADSGQSRVHLLDKLGRRKLHLLTWEDGIVEPTALAITSDGCLVLSEGSTGLIKIFSYTHLPEVTEALQVVEEAPEEIHSDDDGISLQSDEAAPVHQDTDTQTEGKPSEAKHLKGILNPKPKSCTRDAENFQRSLQMLTDDSDDYKRSLGYPSNSKSGWSQMSSNYFSSVPSTAAPRGPHGPKSSKSRLAELNREFEIEAPADEPIDDSTVDGNAHKLSGHFTTLQESQDISVSTPNIRASSPYQMLTEGGKHLSDFTRPVFQLDTPKQSTHRTSRSKATPFSSSRMSVYSGVKLV